MDDEPDTIRDPAPNGCRHVDMAGERCEEPVCWVCGAEVIEEDA